jgi:hypoxanthine phosphoribosyltransferase
MRPDAAEFDRVMQQARVVAEASAVDARILILAETIELELADRLPVVLPILMGGAYLATQLCRHFTFAYELDALTVRRYGSGLVGGALEWLARPTLTLEGRTVLLVDDVLDRGETLQEVGDWLRTQGIVDLRTVVLVSKQAGTAMRPAVDCVGFHCGSEYLIGCGMDFKGLGRGLPALYAIELEQ